MVDFQLVINNCVLIITSVVNVSLSFVMSDRAFSYFLRFTSFKCTAPEL